MDVRYVCVKVEETILPSCSPVVLVETRFSVNFRISLDLVSLCRNYIYFHTKCKTFFKAPLKIFTPFYLMTIIYFL